MLRQQILLSANRDPIAARRKKLEAHWQTFLSQRSPFVIAEVVPRHETHLPDQFCPWAPAIVIPGAYLMKQVTQDDPAGWECAAPGLYQKRFAGNKVNATSVGELWIVERQAEEVLTYMFGPLPVLTRTPQQAMQLAEYCQTHLPRTEVDPWPATLRGLAHSLRWVVSTPDRIKWC
jgi:hypothetical protein